MRAWKAISFNWFHSETRISDGYEAVDPRTRQMAPSSSCAKKTICERRGSAFSRQMINKKNRQKAGFSSGHERSESASNLNRCKIQPRIEKYLRNRRAIHVFGSAQLRLTAGQASRLCVQNNSVSYYVRSLIRRHRRRGLIGRTGKVIRNN